MGNIINLYSPSPRFIEPKRFNLSPSQVEALKTKRMGATIANGLDIDVIKAFHSGYNCDKLSSL